MKDMQIRYSWQHDDVVELVENYVKDILQGDQAVAEPISDMRLEWFFSSLIVGISECYWANNLTEGVIIAGICCPDQGLVQIFKQDHKPDNPQEFLLMLSEQHDPTEYVAIYVEV
jgi:hypothetical protein